MKKIDNRQQKLIQTKAQMKPFLAERVPVREGPSQDENQAASLHGGSVLGLVSNLFLASKIAQAAKHNHLSVHNFDKAVPLLQHAKQKPPSVIFLDWDGCEREAFELLKALKEDEKLKKVGTFGCLSQLKGSLKEEAQRAGCDRIYFKTEFLRMLDDLVARHAV